MPKFAADIPAYVTVRFEARDEAHAREIIARTLETWEYNIGEDRFLNDPSPQEREEGEPLLELSSAITIYGQGIDKHCDVQVCVAEEE